MQHLRYNYLPEIPFAEKFAPLEPNKEVRDTKAQCMTDFVEKLRRRNPHIGLVVELSIGPRHLAETFPSMNPLKEDWVLVQGGATHNWAAAA